MTLIVKDEVASADGEVAAIYPDLAKKGATVNHRFSRVGKTVFH